MLKCVPLAFFVAMKKVPTVVGTPSSLVKQVGSSRCSGSAKNINIYIYIYIYLYLKFVCDA